jgi:hypothetical protein
MSAGAHGIPLFLLSLVGCAGLIGVDRDYTLEGGPGAADATAERADPSSPDVQAVPKDGSPTMPECEGGSCACATSGQRCVRTCKGSGCEFKCFGNSECAFVCAQGACTVATAFDSTATLSCLGGGCTGVASNSSELTVSCPGGNCSVKGTNSAIVNLNDCRGNKCNIECDNSATCQLRGCSADCSIMCGSGATCSNDCTAPSCR